MSSMWLVGVLGMMGRACGLGVAARSFRCGSAIIWILTPLSALDVLRLADAVCFAAVCRVPDALGSMF